MQQIFADWNHVFIMLTAPQFKALFAQKQGALKGPHAVSFADEKIRPVVMCTRNRLSATFLQYQRRLWHNANLEVSRQITDTPNTENRDQLVSRRRKKKTAKRSPCSAKNHYYMQKTGHRAGPPFNLLHTIVPGVTSGFLSFSALWEGIYWPPSE